MLNPSNFDEVCVQPFTLNKVKGMLVTVFLQMPYKERIQGKEKRKRRR
jgi:hypothetical protein